MFGMSMLSRKRQVVFAVCLLGAIATVPVAILLALAISEPKED